jgi:hypothetical protein
MKVASPRSTVVTVTACGFALLSMLCPEAAAAGGGGLKDMGTHHRPQMVSVFTGFHVAHYGGAGVPFALGGRYYYPLVPDGFGSSINDEFGIEAGLDLLVRSKGLGMAMPVAGLYDLHFNDKFDGYVKLGFSLSVGDKARVAPYAAVGMRLALSDSLYFRLEGGYPLVMVGLGFAL